MTPRQGPWSGPVHLVDIDNCLVGLMGDQATCGEHIDAFSLKPVTLSTHCRGNGTGGSHAGCCVICWGCESRITATNLMSVLINSTLKCHTCGAINDNEEAVRNRQIFRQSSRSTFVKLMRLLGRQGMRIVLVIVMMFGSVIGPGACFILPRTCSTPLSFFIHHAITWTLSLTVCYNYYWAVAIKPSRVKERFIPPSREEVLRKPKALDDFRWCHHCQYPIPPSGHHCDFCQGCVLETDHHCPFINTCVTTRRGNSKPYLLFLISMMTANIFCISHTGYLVFFLERPDFALAILKGFSKVYGLWWFCFNMIVFLSLPPTYMAAAWILVISTLALGLVGLLFHGHVKSLRAHALKDHKTLWQWMQQEIFGPPLKLKSI